MRGRINITVVVLLALGVVACDDGTSSDSATGSPPDTTTTQPIQDDQTDGTTEVESMPGDDPVAESGSLVGWELGSSLTGELTQIVSWSEGFAAIMEADGEPYAGGGELWYSADGVEWEAALVRPFGHAADIYALVGHNDQLFALSGDIFDNAAPLTLWQRRAGEPWEEVMTHEALEYIAVSSDRLVGYQQSGFEVVAIFDTTTMEPVEFTGWPEANVEAVGEFSTEPFAYEGRVVGLDEGFLAEVSWLFVIEGPGDGTQIDRRLLYSTDGATWIEHPSPPPGGVEFYGDVHGEAVAPVFEGRNLIASALAPRSEGRDAAWVTDTGMDFEPARLPLSDAAFLVGHANGTGAGFFTVSRGGAIHQSLDGVEWDMIESPPTWSVPAEINRRGFAHGTVLATDDSLIAVGVHAEYEGFVGIVNPNTDIWVAER
jgi:hypothetical protein